MDGGWRMDAGWRDTAGDTHCRPTETAMCEVEYCTLPAPKDFSGARADLKRKRKIKRSLFICHNRGQWTKNAGKENKNKNLAPPALLFFLEK